MTFQLTLPGLPPTVVVGARPQSNNESNDFILDMESASTQAMASTGVHPSSFLNYAVDGVSCESRHVWKSICDFLSCKSNHLGSTDTNHNMKSWRYQIIGGGGDVGISIGKVKIDTDLLRLGGVSHDLIRPKDFASDNLVKALVSYETIKKVKDASVEFGSTIEGDKAALAATLFFMHLQLYSINAKSVTSKHQVVYLWCSMVWLTSIHGASVITKRNIVSSVIPLVFLCIREDVHHSRYCTSEPIEHTFGNNRAICREFTVLNFCELIEKQIRRLKLMYKDGFNPSRDPQKGYQATYNEFFEYSVSSRNKGVGENIDSLLHDGDYIAKQLWDTITKLITVSNNHMRKLFEVIGVPRKEISPFCQHFSTLEKLCDEFIKFCPRTFKYGDIAGSVVGSNTIEIKMDEEESLSNEELLCKIGKFANDMKDACSNEVIEIVDNEKSEDVQNDKDNNQSNGTKNKNKLGSTMNCEVLMTHFKSIMVADSTHDLLTKVANASAYLSGVTPVQGALGTERKAKSLFGRWTTKGGGGTKLQNDSTMNDRILIERDTIVLVNTKSGIGSTSTIIMKPFRVLTIYEKFYNKWFIAKEPFKKWRDEENSYKLDVCMLDKDILDEYSDVELISHDLYDRSDMYKTIKDSMIVDVVGKLTVAV